MAIVIKGTGSVNDATDFKDVVWSGKTKNGKACTITLKRAINKGNIDLSFVEKDDTVQQIVFTGSYNNTDHMVSDEADYEEPWEISYAGGASDAAAGTILLGAGVVSIGGTDVALTRAALSSLLSASLGTSTLMATAARSRDAWSWTARRRL